LHPALEQQASEPAATKPEPLAVPRAGARTRVPGG